MEKHKECQLESATMDSSSSPQGATGSAKTDPSNAYQQQVLFELGVLFRVDPSA
jgi:hypothetical protein